MADIALMSGHARKGGRRNGSARRRIAHSTRRASQRR